MTDKELLIWQRAIVRKLRLALRTMGVVVLIMMVGFVLTGLAAKSQATQRANDAKAQATQRAQDAVLFAKKIQDERKRSLVTGCQDTNANNLAANEEAKKLPPSAIPPVIKIIDRLAPYRADCGDYADTRVKAK